MFRRVRQFHIVRVPEHLNPVPDRLKVAAYPSTAVNQPPTLQLAGPHRSIDGGQLPPVRNRPGYSSRALRTRKGGMP